MAMSIFTRQNLSIGKTAAIVLVAVILILVDSKKPEWFSWLRGSSHAAMQPIYQMSVLPSFMGHWAGGTFSSKEALRRENVQLQTQLLHANTKLQQQDYVLAQNARLQGILSATKSDGYTQHLAQVIGTDTNPQKQIMVLNKGREDGVEVGQTVIDERGLLGQIINVYPSTSRLLLITDELQSIAVVVRRTGQRAIISGQGTPKSLGLKYIFKTSDIRIGDELISSGLDGRFPAGYRVGRVESINPVQTDEFMNISVAPAADFYSSAYVLILQPKNDQTGDAGSQIKIESSLNVAEAVRLPSPSQGTDAATGIDTLVPTPQSSGF